jgi:Flp pilus assembly protein RcpC/CpaB
MTAPGISSGAWLRPLAHGIAARPRRWMRWAAIALAALTLLSAAAQLHRRPAMRPKPAQSSSVRPHPAAVRAEATAIPAPAGLRAVTVPVPASAMPAGRLVPSSRVDVFAAFDTAQERVVRRVLSSALVLRASSVPPQAAGAAGRGGPPPAADVSLAIPVSCEPDVVLALAFGRLYVVAVSAESGPHTAADAMVENRGRAAMAQAEPDDQCGTALRGPRSAGDIGGPADPDSLSVSRYLGLPPGRSTLPYPAVPPFVPEIMAFPPRTWPPQDASATSPRAPAWRQTPEPAPPAATAHDRVRIVEIIEGTARGFTEVPP